MIVPGMPAPFPTLNGWRFFQRPTWQWQPTTTVHDPNPPMALETPAPPATPGANYIFLPMMGVG